MREQTVRRCAKTAGASYWKVWRRNWRTRERAHETGPEHGRATSEYRPGISRAGRCHAARDRGEAERAAADRFEPGAAPEYHARSGGAAPANIGAERIGAYRKSRAGAHLQSRLSRSNGGRRMD